jgi:hypothetical protein
MQSAPMQRTRCSMYKTAPAADRAAVQVRLEGPLYQALENWRRSRAKIPPRSEALRELLERALAEQQAGAA